MKKLLTFELDDKVIDEIDKFVELNNLQKTQFLEKTFKRFNY